MRFSKRKVKEGYEFCFNCGKEIHNYEYILNLGSSGSTYEFCRICAKSLSKSVANVLEKK